MSPRASGPCLQHAKQESSDKGIFSESCDRYPLSSNLSLRICTSDQQGRLCGISRYKPSDCKPLVELPSGSRTGDLGWRSLCSDIRGHTLLAP